VTLVAVVVVSLGACGSPTAGSSPTPRPTASPSAPLVSSSPTRIPMPTQTVLSAPSDALLWAEVGDAVLYRSTDRGDNWTEVNLPVPTHEITFADAYHGWLLGPASPATQCQSESVDLRATSDGGVTWQKMQPHGIASAQCKESLSFTDASHGFVGAWDDNGPPVIYRTADGGSTWRSSAPLADPPGWASHPGGWELRTGPVHAFGTALLVTVTNNVGQTYVYRSADGGANWSYYRTLPASGGYPGFATAERWLILAIPGQSQETTDGGSTWHRSTSDYNQAAPVAPAITFADAMVGYATVRGAIQRTVDGGQHWSTISTPGT